MQTNLEYEVRAGFIVGPSVVGPQGDGHVVILALVGDQLLTDSYNDGGQWSFIL